MHGATDFLLSLHAPHSSTSEEALQFISYRYSVHPCHWITEHTVVHCNYVHAMHNYSDGIYIYVTMYHRQC